MLVIEEEQIRFVAAVDFTDDCRVLLTTRKGRETRLTASQARELAAGLVQAAEEAERAAQELLPPIRPAGFDVLHISPDCQEEKHKACNGRAWSETADDEVPCEDTCHWDTASGRRSA